MRGYFSVQSAWRDRSAPLASARRDLFVLAIVIAAVVLLIWNGSAFFQRLSLAGSEMESGLKIAAVALTLNVALILFGWRRYVDLQHEAELRRDGEARAALIASTDGMTGLLNRKGFADDGEELRLSAQGRDQSLIIFSLQLNRFKAVNDRHGYDVGDAALRQIALELREIVGSEPLVARLAGDEFAVAFAAAAGDTEPADLLAERLLQAVTRPMEIDGRLVQVGAFLGIAESDPGEGQVPDFLRRADIALDRAKSTRSARPIWFDQGMERALIAHSEIEQGIRHGLEHGQFIPYFEAQVDLLTGNIVGFEVLARWDHPLSGPIEPSRFIPIAEEHGLIGRLSEQVILNALAQAVAWDPSIKISVNISPTQLTDSWLAQRIVRLLAETGFPAERLVVEITESSLFADLDLARTIVTSLKNQGIRLALDDFGTGFSSLAHLRALPFDVIKIDRSFVATLATDPESAAIVRAVATLAEALKVPVTVEGIEDATTHAAVAGFGCSVGQGWYFGKPISGDQVTAMLRSRHVAPSAHKLSAHTA
ncbi:putative bifunctional diguanylate cyclase/phosphodiesterase [Sphingomonas xanthus]|uniref:Bifunctional diguanylate cyclase/phosphodiesterase n=1 Tax=Sphingomonas xanthus TaxID=2594473 RepID=A0A516IT87_9SPHN|nr:bifunctional diguanylate cyclase/phosphodiesterase [Sphingomonas xanthus]QDP20095.1 bifunctional diguanylate cyclase/phosphodiesterase [Sphingomonas xanthus]